MAFQTMTKNLNGSNRPLAIARNKG